MNNITKLFKLAVVAPWVLVMCTVLTIPAQVFAQGFSVSVISATPFSPPNGVINSWCQITFEVENDTRWLARHIHIGAVVSSRNGRKLTAFLDLRAVDPGARGVVQVNLAEPCSNLVEEFTLLPARRHLGFRCLMTNHSTDACFAQITLTDRRPGFARDPSTSEAFALLRFGMSVEDIQQIYPALNQANGPFLALPGQFDSRFWTDREPVNATPARQILLFDRISDLYIGHIIEIPQTGVPVAAGLSVRTCELLRADIRSSKGEGQNGERYGASFEFWVDEEGRIEFHASRQRDGTVSGCRLYRVAPDALRYFDPARMALDVVFDIEDLNGIYVPMSGPQACPLESFDTANSMIGIMGEYIEFEGTTCEFRQTGNSGDGQEIWGNATCYSADQQGEVQMRLRADQGNLVIRIADQDVQPFRRCWMRQ